MNNCSNVCIKCGSYTQRILCNKCSPIKQEEDYNMITVICEICKKEITHPPCDCGISLEKKEQVDHPKHYNHGKIEVIDALEDWDLGFHLGNVVKYVSRAGRKSDDTEIEDLRKALWYLQRRISMLEKKEDEQ